MSLPETPEEIHAALTAPFPDELVYDAGTKKGTFHYVNADMCADRLDEVFGPTGWSSSTERFDDRWAVKCTITAAGHAKSGVGYPNKDENAKNTDGSSAFSTEPLKESETDAFRRAAENWGIGRYLTIRKRIAKAANPQRATDYYRSRGHTADQPQPTATVSRETPSPAPPSAEPGSAPPATDAQKIALTRFAISLSGSKLAGKAKHFSGKADELSQTQAAELIAEFSRFEAQQTPPTP